MDKLTVCFAAGAEALEPTERKYTLTHSDETGQRYVHIDRAYGEVSPLHDEVTGAWVETESGLAFCATCPLYSPVSKRTPEERLAIFKRHMPRAVAAMLAGDAAYIKTRGLECCPVFCRYEGGGIDVTDAAGTVRDQGLFG